jgi:hypothetical protein
MALSFCSRRIDPFGYLDQYRLEPISSLRFASLAFLDNLGGQRDPNRSMET